MCGTQIFLIIPFDDIFLFFLKPGFISSIGISKLLSVSRDGIDK